MSYLIPGLNGAVQDRFVDALDVVAQTCWINSRDHGFHEARRVNDLDPAIREMSDIVALDLIHSELSEALEAIRHGNEASDKIPSFSGMEEELADAIIRILDLAHSRHLRLGEAILSKMAYNSARSHLHGGKRV